jgi:uncharacterized membrane protein YgcG
MNVMYIFLGIALVHFIWAFINTISIRECFFISKPKKIGMFILTWMIPLIGPVIVYKSLKYASQHRRMSNGGSDSTSGYYSGSESSGTDCGGGGGE